MIKMVIKDIILNSLVKPQTTYVNRGRLMLWFLREKETRIILSILGIAGGFPILMTVTRAPGLGIGICGNPDMPCVIYMRPATYTVAPLIVAASAVGLAINLIGIRPGMGR